MPLRTILSCLSTEGQAHTVLGPAAALARRTDAHLIGLHTLEAMVIYPGIAVHVPETVQTNFTAAQRERAQVVRTLFDERLRGETFTSEWREIKTEAAASPDRMIEAARTSDLVVMARAGSDGDRDDQPYVQERMIRESGRPVLLIPPKLKDPEIGKSVVIGWSSTREAARAVHDVRPLLQDGAEVHIVTVTGSLDHTDSLATELARTLSRHGFKAEVVRRAQDGQSIAECLLQEAFERGADLIATGAFGHSRLFDFVIGAVTLELMRKAERPVLLST